MHLVEVELNNIFASNKPFITTGGSTVTWANTIKWSGGSAPPQTTAANANDIYSFITFDGGTTFWGSLSVKDGR